MAAYKLEVVRRGYIIVDDVDDWEHAEEYIENCNPVDEVEWSSFLETTPCGTELEEVYIPDTLTVRELAERLGDSVKEIISWLFILNDGLTVTEESVINFESAEKLGNRYDVLFKRIEKVTYYEDYRLKVIEQDGNYTIYDKKYGDRAIRKNKTKEWVDDYIQRTVDKRKGKRKQNHVSN